MPPRLTREQAAIIGAYTGICCGPVSDIQALAEALLERPIWTHEFADKAVWAELKERVKPQFVAMCAESEAK